MFRTALCYIHSCSAAVMHVMGRPRPTRWRFYYSSTRALNIALLTYKPAHNLRRCVTELNSLMHYDSLRSAKMIYYVWRCYVQQDLLLQVTSILLKAKLVVSYWDPAQTRWLCMTNLEYKQHNEQCFQSVVYNSCLPGSQDGKLHVLFDVLRRSLVNHDVTHMTECMRLLDPAVGS